MFHFPTRVTLRMDIADFLELESALQSHGVHRTSAQEQETRRIMEFPRNCLAGGLALENLFHQLRHLGEVGQM